MIPPPAKILDGPTGRLLLASHALAVTGKWALLDYELTFFAARPDLAADLERAVDTIISDPFLAEAFVGPALLLQLGQITSGFHHGFAVRGSDGLNALAANAVLLRPLERAVSQHPAHRWWWGLLGESQVLTEGALGVRFDLERPTYNTGDQWSTASSYKSTLISTRGPVAHWPSVAAMCGEDLTSDHPQTWPFAVPEGQVLEIHSSDDFVKLVEAYPRRWADPFGAWKSMTGADGPWCGPDWDALRQEYAGVHLSLAGYLSTAYRPLSTSAGLALLAGWEPDGTVWFNQQPQKLLTP